MHIKGKANISDDLRRFIISGNYEKYLFQMMNDSRIVFPGNYERHLNQSRGQCDFYDVETLEKYDAKLPFDDIEGKLINTESDFFEWLKFMMKEAEEFGSQSISNRGKYKIEDLQLYKTLAKRLKTLNEDENPIFLFPFPIVMDIEPNSDIFPVLQRCTDYLSALFRTLESNDCIGKRMIYTVYPSYDGKMVLRCLNTNIREYVCYKELKEIFYYKFIQQIQNKS